MFVLNITHRADVDDDRLQDVVSIMRQVVIRAAVDRSEAHLISGDLVGLQSDINSTIGRVTSGYEIIATLQIPPTDDPSLTELAYTLAIARAARARLQRIMTKVVTDPALA